MRSALCAFGRTTGKTITMPTRSGAAPTVHCRLLGRVTTSEQCALQIRHTARPFDLAQKQSADLLSVRRRERARISNRSERGRTDCPRRCRVRHPRRAWDGSEQSSNQRPDTLMQDRICPDRRKPLATHGRTIQMGHNRRSRIPRHTSGLP
jgi:hypothetical protein